MPSRNPNRPAPKRRDPNERHPDWVEPKPGIEFVLQRYQKGRREVVERTKVRRVVRQGTPEHGQHMVWTVEYEVEGIDDWDRVATLRVITWVMYDSRRREWADARLVQDEALARGAPIYATPSKEPPFGRVS